MSEIPAIVDIADVITDVELVNPRELEAGDVLFDCFGGGLLLERVTHFKHTTRTKRADGVWESWDHAGGGITRKVRS